VRARLARLALAALGGLLEALALPLVVPGLTLRQVDPRGLLEVLGWVGLVPALVALRGAAGAPPTPLAPDRGAPLQIVRP
jgi:apolipoprotein N-acyltransferase